MNNSSLPRRQRGAALMVGLMLLIVVTLVALSAIRMTNTQQILAGNMQQRMIVYQGAESAIRELVNLIDPPGGGGGGTNLLVTTITNALDGDATTGPPAPTALPAEYPADINGTAALAYTGTALVPGGEIGAGTIVYRTFLITATAQMPAYNSQDTHFQGLWQLAPSL